MSGGGWRVPPSGQLRRNPRKGDIPHQQKNWNPDEIRC